MPTNYAGDPTSYPADVPLPDDGEPCAAAFLSPSWQRLADRTAYVKAALVDSLADFAALKAIDTTTYAYGTKRYILAQGIYELEDIGAGGPHSLAQDDFPWTVAPTTGPGVWRAAAHYASTMSILVGCAMTRISSSAGAAAAETRASYSGTMGAVGVSHADQAVNFFAPRQVSTATGKSYYYAMNLDPYMIDHAHLDTVVLRYNVGASHSGLPALFPGLRVEYQEPGFASGNYGTFVYDTESVLGSYTSERTVTYTASANTINKSNRSYALVIADEGGANALVGNTFISALLSFTTIKDARPK